MSSNQGDLTGKRILLAGDASALESVRKLLPDGERCKVDTEPDGARAASLALEERFDAVLVCCRHPHQEFLRLLGTLFSQSGVVTTALSPEESVPASGA